ncbi:hypothetical protein ACFOY4_01455 [Actinomadura syzygii]|uniref:Uncharacterized protein n=1 Tax=Actinomadura syzygii TaxID=1427538 RepID=A0A5D0TTB0_9ACTN|nr:hypothetical protein [Actinomadura syzygii]TYC08586.1 hypothetical protein FXF65_37470 [Actinomadura syzygii]
MEGVVKLRFEFSVEIDASLFQAVEALNPQGVRKRAACEFAADITETDFYEKFVDKVTWYRMGGSDIPYVVEHAS